MKKTLLRRTGETVAILAVNLIILLALLYGFEYYLGITDPKLKLPPRPVETINHYGFREREFVTPKPAGVCRIMALGDSFTWGKEVWVEERYTTLLETYLNQAYPYQKFEVLNFGFTGAPTTKERDSLLKYKDLTQPDLITLGFVINDPQPKHQNYSVEREQWDKQYGQKIDSFLEDVEDLHLEHTADLIRKALDNFIIKVGIVPTWQVALQRTYETDSPEWQQFVKALRDIKTTSDQLGLPQPLFAALNQGLYTVRPTDYSHPDAELQTFLRWYRQAEETANDLGYDTLNFEQEFAEQLSGQIMAANSLDLHPSPMMHRIYAQKMFKEISRYIDEGRLCPQPPAQPR